MPASHQSQIRVQHKGATFSSHIDFGPADHLHDEYGNIISLTKSGNGTLPENPITTVHRPSNTTFSLYQEKPVRGANGKNDPLESSICIYIDRHALAGVVDFMDTPRPMTVIFFILYCFRPTIVRGVCS